jgi:cytochrome c-type biogenesis protein CcmH
VRKLIWIALVLATALSASNDERVRALQDRFLAPCCWSESVLRHRSEIAADLRQELTAMVQEGKSDREITDALIARYGRRILRVPEGGASWVLNSVALAFLALGTAVVVFVIRRWRSGAPQPRMRPASTPDIPDEW